MAFALLLIGLLPLAILPEVMGSSEDDEDEADSVELPVGEGDLLSPIIEDDLPGFDPVPDDTAVLQPVIEDDVPSFEAAPADPLVPVNEIEAESRPFRLSFEEITATGYAEISGFDPDHDMIEVSIENSSLQGSLDVDVTPGADWSDARVYVEGLLLAVLPNAPDAGLHNIDVTVLNA